MKTERLKCGCAFTHEPARWVKECDKHRSETSALRARWAAERKISRPIVAGDTPAEETT